VIPVGFLLDTNVISEARRKRPDSNVEAWLTTVPEAELYVSVLVVGEIRQGIERLRRRDRSQAVVFETWLSALLSGYADRIIPVTAEVAEEWGRMNVPDPLPMIDGLMAATAKLRGWTFVTRNVADLARCGVRLLNPFEPHS
jgi:predicted nucleic acid-binding protein